jgi:hypothetical protein
MVNVARDARRHTFFVYRVAALYAVKFERRCGDRRGVTLFDDDFHVVVARVHSAYDTVRFLGFGVHDCRDRTVRRNEDGIDAFVVSDFVGDL